MEVTERVTLKQAMNQPKGHNMLTKTIDRYERLNSSVNGNPRYRFHFTDGTTLDGTSDAGWAYAVGNPEMREGSTVALELTRAGRIRVMREAS